MVITIDGPVAAGKTTLARQLARRLDLVLLDTGAIYRCVALAAKVRGVAWSDETRVAEVAGAIAISFGQGDERGRVWLDGQDVSEEIRLPAISEGASIVSAHPAVRRALLQLQRRQAATADLIAEGRDTGTVVFPLAEHKFFLTARPEVRARRRWRELRQRGTEVDLATVLEELESRDRRDKERPVAPLRPAEDAVAIDSSGMGPEDVVQTVLSHLSPGREPDPEEAS